MSCEEEGRNTETRPFQIKIVRERENMKLLIRRTNNISHRKQQNILVINNQMKCLK